MKTLTILFKEYHDETTDKPGNPSLASLETQRRVLQMDLEKVKLAIAEKEKKVSILEAKIEEAIKEYKETK